MTIPASIRDGFTEYPATARVLVVDDEGLVCWSLQKSLLRAGFLVETATSVEGARELIRNQAFDVCVTDLKLGTGSGFEVAHVCKQCHPSSVVLMISAFLNDLECHEKNPPPDVDILLEKPLDLQEVVSVVRRLTGRMGEQTGTDEKPEGDAPAGTG